jgi:hypothetical protein
MAVTNAANGTATPTVGGAATTLATITTPGVYVLTLNLANMASGDTVTVRARTKALTGGTLGDVMARTFTGAQTVPIRQSIPVLSEHEVAFTLTQTAGTARSFPWSVAAA